MDLPHTIYNKIHVMVASKKVNIDSYTASLIAKNIPDEECKSYMFRALAKINDSSVRETVASKHSLDKETILMLGNDSDVNVLSSLLQNSYATKYLKYKLLKKIIIERDSILSVHIAESIYYFKKKYQAKLSNLLYKHRDYRVRMGLLHEYNTGVPKKIVKKLVHDKNKKVAREAIIELKERKDVKQAS